MIYLFIILLLVFQGALVTISPRFNNIDEAVTIFLALITFKRIFIDKKEIKLYKYEIISLVSIVIFFILGNISMVYSQVHNDYIFSSISGILTIKSILIYFMARICLNNYKFNITLLIKYDRFLEFILWIYFIIAILDTKFNFISSMGVRNGIKSISMGFSHPSTFEYFIICIMIIRLFINVKFREKINQFYITLIQSTILIILAGRSKGIAFIALFTLCYFIAKYFKRFNLKYMLATSPIVVCLSMDRITTSLLSTEEARNVLYRTSFEIANEYFPLGSGFSTFGSDFSRVRYSPLYFKYGISNVWGLSQDKNSFITDTQWASVIGESGYIGVLLFFISLIYILAILLKISKDSLVKLSLVSLLGYGIISSISDSILVSFRGAGIFFIVAFLISIERYELYNKL